MAITDQDARLLLTRTGFTPTQAELKAIEAAPTRAAAVEQVLASITATPTVAPPAWTALPKPREAQPPSPANLLALEQLNTQERDELISWAAVEMLGSTSPLSQRLQLFWHNLFTSQLSVVGSAWLMWNQHMVILNNMGGSYATMLSQIVHNPATVDYLNQDLSTAAAPSANLARELMELFTIGIGNYTETDVSEVARALTGLTISPDGLPLFNPKIHDNGSKTILGNTGNWGPDDVVRILLAQPSLAPRIVNRLWTEFVSPYPDPNQVTPIAAAFAASNYQITPVLRALFNSPTFWDPANRGTLIKSPAEFVIGAARELGLSGKDPLDYVGAMKTTGYRLFEPPNVRGYLTGTNWINTLTIVTRKQIGAQMASQWGSEVLGSPNPLPMVTPQAYLALATPRMGDVPILATPTQSIDIISAQTQVLSDPAYSLK